LQALREEGFEATGYFDNPNIHPYREFQARLSAYRLMADREGLEAETREDYGLSGFLGAIKALDDSAYQAVSEERCRACYRLRLERAAIVCKNAGLQVFTTTLLVSPYQRHDLIREIGEKIGEAYGLNFLYRDFRPGFRSGQAMAREMGLYMQGYCGCVFSEFERYGGARK